MMIDDLSLIKRLGQGSFGEVFLTSKKGHSQLYATKKIPKAIVDSEKVKKYFKNEIIILQQLNHKNIMKLIEIKQTKDNYYLVCELCNGGSLNECLDKYRKINRKPFTEEVVQYLMRQIVDAIKYIHQNHIIHRDLKLDNILVNFDNEEDKKNMNLFGAQVKIIDFGFAIHLDPKKKKLAFSTLGSPINMDPGILKKLNHQDNEDTGYDEKVDIWSLGTLCYEMLIGKATFEADSINELVKKVENGEYTLPSTLSKEVVSFLNAMLQYDPKIRLSAEELSRHHFLTKNIKEFTKIDISKVQNILTKEETLKINVKKNQSIWSIFNNDEVLNEVPGYILNEKKDDFLAPIPENDGNFEQNNMNNQQYNNQNNYMRSNTQRVAIPNNYGFVNHLEQKSKSFNDNNNPNNIDTQKGRAYSHYSVPKKEVKNLKEYLQKAFDVINEDFLYLSPIFIPLIPGNDINDKYNEEEQL